MKKNNLTTSLFISLVLNCLAQEQPAEYYIMKYFPYSLSHGSCFHEPYYLQYCFGS